MRHEIQFEIHCGAECVIVQGPGNMAEDQGSPEASQAWSSHGPRAGLCDSREPIWGDRLGTEPPQCSPGHLLVTAKQCPKMSLCPQVCHCLGFFCQRIQLLGKIQTDSRVPRCVLPRSSHCGHSVFAIQTGICLRFGGRWRVGVFPVGCRDLGLSVPVLQGGSTTDQTSERKI